MKNLGAQQESESNKESVNPETIRIGISGHRCLADIGKIENSLERAFQKIQQTFPSRKLQLITPLAQGSDCLTARCFLRFGHVSLLVPLPFSKEEYLKDFSSSEAVDEFIFLLNKAEQVVEMPLLPTRNEAYLQVGEFVHEQSDIIILIWDGEAAHGKGGTGEIAEKARERELPIVWIKAGNRIPGTTCQVSLGEEQGKLTFENFSA